jgi:outer membrane biosynthesis protein TonB
MSLAFVCNAQETESNSECDFSSYKPLVISHAPLGGAVKKVEPEYPAVARAARSGGQVQVKTLVDLKGNVVRACAAHGHPLLRHAAEKAALEWKFKRNFGFSSKSKFKRKYLQSWIVFTFRLA